VPVDAAALAALDHRERNYERTDVTAAVDGAPDGPVWTYAGRGDSRARFAAAVAAAAAACHPPSQAGRASAARCVPRPGDAAASGPAYSMDAVDRVAEPWKSNPQPKFPSNFGGANGAAYAGDEHTATAGEVDIQFIVDANGCVEADHYRVIASTDSLFTRAVLDVLPLLHYRPAERNGASVRSWLRWKFLFYQQHGARRPT
jgi:hypothetical protein